MYLSLHIPLGFLFSTYIVLYQKVSLFKCFFPTHSSFRYRIDLTQLCQLSTRNNCVKLHHNKIIGIGTLPMAPTILTIIWAGHKLSWDMNNNWCKVSLISLPGCAQNSCAKFRLNRVVSAGPPSKRAEGQMFIFIYNKISSLQTEILFSKLSEYISYTQKHSQLFLNRECK